MEDGGRNNASAAYSVHRSLALYLVMRSISAYMHPPLCICPGGAAGSKASGLNREQQGRMQARH